jgi:hypothetical protein
MLAYSLQSEHLSRKGSFWNFDVFQHLGDGASDEVRRRSRRAMSELRQFLDTRIASADYELAGGFLRQLHQDTISWESDLVKAARHFAGSVYKLKLMESSTLWEECENLYGQGLPYRETVASILESWFDKHPELKEELDANFQLAWQQTVIEPLLAAANG